MPTPHPDDLGTDSDKISASSGLVKVKQSLRLSASDLEYRDQHPDRKILAVKGSCVVDDDTLLENARIAMRIGYPEISAPQQVPYITPLIIVGAGLSAEPFVDEIREKAHDHPVLALKGAHNWLIENGIVPTFACALDPQEHRATCFKNPRDDVIYLVASTVHPKTWLHLSGKRVLLFHQYFCERQKTLPEWEGKAMLGGGCSTGMRALPMMYYMGFRRFELYGYDSCVRADGVYKLEDYRAKAEVFPVYVGDREFMTTTSLYAQVQDLRDVLMSMPGIRVTAYGDGIFQEVLRRGKAAGWPV